MRPLSLLAFLSLFGKIVLLAQTPTPIDPAWELSYGNQEHTNRDELVQMARDPDGNLILLGFVERDSTFADVSVQKVSPEGNLLWDYRFDSSNNKDYDVPSRMSVDQTGNITVLGQSNGLVSFFSPQRNNGFLFKLSNEGLLQWQVAFDTLGILPDHESGAHLDGFADTLNQFTVCYSTYKEFGSRPTYFLTFSPNGSVVHSTIKYNLLQPVGGGVSAIAQAIDSLRNFLFVQFDENSYPQHFIRKINPLNGNEQTKQLNISALSFQDSLRYAYLNWGRLWVDDLNELYTANNLTTGAWAPTFFVAKVKPNGELRYIFSPNDTLEAHFADLKPWRGYAYTTGSYQPSGSNALVAFLWKIDGQGNIEQKIIQSAPNNCVPRYLDIVDGKLYWATEEVASGKVVLKELDPTNLSVLWQYTLHKDPAPIFTGVKFTRIQNGLAAFGGTLSKEKQPGSGYLSEDDFYLETFFPLQNELHAPYQMSEKGTTYVESTEFSIDPAGNIYTRSIELDGPEYYLIQYAPRKYYYRKFSTSGALLWSTLSAGQPYYQYGTDAFFFDHQGNAYTLEYGQQASLLIQKISAQGQLLNTYSVSGYRHLYIDRQNRLHLTYSVGNDAVPHAVVLDDHFQVLQTGPVGLLPVKIFELPSDNAVYAYMEDPAEWGETQVKMVLYKDNQLIWERIFNFNSAEYQRFTYKDMDPGSGALLATSTWRNAAGSYELALHRFTIGNDYQTQVIPTPDNEFPGAMSYLANGSVYLAFQKRLDLYDQNFQAVQTIPISDAPAGGYFLKSGSVFYRVNNEHQLDAYSGNGAQLFSLANPAFSVDPNQISFHPNHQLICTDIFGDWIGGGYDYGWRWYRGRLRAFDLSGWLPTPTCTPTLEAPEIVCSPNPAHDMLKIYIRNYSEKQVRITLVNASGIKMYDQTLPYQEHQPLSLALVSMPAGIYFVHAGDLKNPITAQKIVVLKP